MKPAIRVENLSKQYRIGTKARPGSHNLTESIVDSASALWRGLTRQARGGDGANEFWALKDVSFAVRPGEVVGILGRNGAGKSTLLKILSRITEPTTGRAVVRGRMGSLLEVGTGFHPELTGRENIYLNGSILGMSRGEIDRNFDEIVAFSGIERFLDSPVKRYSSGMYVRLAFAVAAYLEPEILVVDEVLAVGDAQFQDRCINRMRNVSRAGRTVLFVSHNMPAIQNLCSRCILLKGGKVEADGKPEEVIKLYHAGLSGGAGSDVSLLNHPGRRFGCTPTMARVYIQQEPCGSPPPFQMMSDIRITVEFDSPDLLDDITFGLVVKNRSYGPVFGINNLVTPSPVIARPMSKGSVSCILRAVPLMPGRYPIDLYFGNRGHNLDVIDHGIEVEITPGNVFGSGRLPPSFSGDVFWPAEWEFTPGDFR